MKNRNSGVTYIIIGIIICMIAFTFQSCNDSYTSVMTSAVKKALGKDFKGYHCPSFPTNNFGLMTTYDNDVSAQNMLCAMSSCFDTLVKNDDNFGGLADIGSGPAIKLNQNNQISISAKVMPPEISKILKLDAGIDSKTIKSYSLTFGPTYERHLNRLKFDDLINKLPVGNSYKTRFLSGNLIVVIADVVVESMEVTVEVEQNIEANLDAKINSGQIITNDTINGEFKKVTTGKYEFKINKPLIVLRLAKKQSKGGLLSTSSTFDDWTIVSDSI